MNRTGKDKHKCEYTDKKQGKIRFEGNDGLKLRTLFFV